MSSSHLLGNRNSTPEASKSSLRPPSSRNIGAGHHLRASADMAAAFPSSPLSTRNIRPSSEVYFNQTQQGQNQTSAEDTMDEAAKQWIADIDQYETTLEEMAAATLDQDFKDELSAIEQWFRVLSEAERTAALYALLGQTTQVQIRFFIQVLQQMAKSHPVSGMLSPANFGEKDAMSNRLSDAMSKLNVEGSRNSMGRPPPSPAVNRNSALDPESIKEKFPEAVAVVEQKKAEYARHTQNAPSFGGAGHSQRSSLIAPTISAPDENNDSLSKSTPSLWGQRDNDNQSASRPKSSSGQQPMGQFSQPPPSAGLHSHSPQPLNLSGNSNIQHTTIAAPDNKVAELPLLSPYNLGNSSWASMTNTPMTATFNSQATQLQADMVANATAMKLAALSTVNNRIALDDVRKYRRSRSNDGHNGQSNNQLPMSPGMPNTSGPGTNVVMIGENGQVLNSHQMNPQQLAALQAHNQAALGARRSRPNSPGLMVPGAGISGMGFASPQNNGFLAAYDGSSPLVSLNQLGMGHTGGHEGYLSDHSEMARGRSPRGRRGTSKPPEDPTDLKLLEDIPQWLRSLRLHKYTDNLKDLKWQDIIQLDDKGLEGRGVNALGARRKMLKVFDQVKEARSEGKLPS